MRTIIAALAICFFAATGNALEVEVSKPTFAVQVNDAANFQPDGKPLRQRWGICYYEVTVASRDGEYKTSWKYSRPMNHPSSIVYLGFAEDRALPDEGTYDLTIKVNNMGEEGGRFITRSSPNPLTFAVTYRKPETPLVTPDDLTEGMIGVIEDETQF